MKLISTAPPRLDDTVIYEFGGKAYHFARDDNGDMVGIVDDAEALRWAIGTGNFFPADEKDEAELLDEVAPKPAAKKRAVRKKAD